MIITDKDKIRSILSMPDIAETFYDEKGHVDCFGDSVLYFFYRGCLFPSVLRGDVISIHAAIPKKYRGVNSIKAAKSVFSWVFENLGVKRIASRIEKTRKNVSFYAIMCGMSYTHECDKYRYYEVING